MWVVCCVFESLKPDIKHTSLIPFDSVPSFVSDIARERRAFQDLPPHVMCSLNFSEALPCHLKQKTPRAQSDLLSTLCKKLAPAAANLICWLYDRQVSLVFRSFGVCSVYSTIDYGFLSVQCPQKALARSRWSWSSCRAWIRWWSWKKSSRTGFSSAGSSTRTCLSRTSSSCTLPWKRRHTDGPWIRSPRTSGRRGMGLCQSRVQSASI